MSWSGFARVPSAIILCVLLAIPAAVPHAQTQAPEQVRPSTGTFEELRKASTDVAQTVGEHLDAGHDWLYRKIERWLENLDMRFVGPDEERIVVPLSPLRIGMDTEFLHRRGGIALLATPNFEAWLRLPNIERRLKVFITSTDVAESPADPTLEHNPVQLGMQFAPLSHVNFEFGAQAKLWPAVFAALRWAPAVDAGDLKVYPFAKAYVQSGLGLGVSGGVTLEHWSGRWIMRSASYANWVRNTAYTDWTQTFIVGYVPAVIHQGRYGSVADGRDLACGVALRLSVSGDRASRTSLYEESVIVKRPLHGGWLFGYVEPIVRWDRNYDWHPDLGVRIGLDALFWGLATRPTELATYCRWPFAKGPGGEPFMMQFRQLKIFAAAIMASTFAGCIAVSVVLSPKPVTLATGTPGGIYHPVGNAVCRMFNLPGEHQPKPCVAVTSDGSVANIRRVENGESAFGLSQTDVAYAAFHGEGPFAATGPNPKLRMLIALYPEAFTVVARADTGIRDFLDLRGKRVGIGKSGAGYTYTRDVLVELYDWMIPNPERVLEFGPADQNEALCNNKVDAIIFAASHPNGLTQEATTGCRSRLVRVTGPPIDRLLATHPYYIASVIPGGMYPGNPNDVPTISTSRTRYIE